MQNCCSRSRAIGIFEALCVFDQLYLSELELATGPGSRRSIVSGTSLVPSPANTFVSNWEKSVVSVLHTVKNFLSPDDDPDLTFETHPSVGYLFTLSCLPKFMDGLLRSHDVAYWIMHSEAYILILGILRLLVECGLGKVFNEPQANIIHTPGLRRWMRGEGRLTWQQESGRVLFRPALFSLVKPLEAHRVGLLTMASAVEFPPLVEKLYELVDGVMHLLLQQMLQTDED